MTPREKKQPKKSLSIDKSEKPAKHLANIPEKKEPVPLPDDIIIGRNSVSEALKISQRVNRLLVATSQTANGPIREIIALAKAQKVNIEYDKGPLIEKIATGYRHQGIIAYVSPVAYADFEELVEKSLTASSQPLFLLLDGLEDPHNLGAILRTADAVGAAGILIPRHHSVPLNATVAKTSAGAIESVPVARIGNISQALATLKKKGFWIVGADMAGNLDYDEADFSGAITIVIGGEGKGLSRLTKEQCDFLVRLPMVGKINSLNASVAAAILMYEAFRQKRKKN